MVISKKDYNAISSIMAEDIFNKWRREFNEIIRNLQDEKSILAHGKRDGYLIFAAMDAHMEAGKRIQKEMIRIGEKLGRANKEILSYSLATPKEALH